MTSPARALPSDLAVVVSQGTNVIVVVPRVLADTIGGPVVQIGGVELAPGDYMLTQPGEEHDVVAMSDAVIFVSSQKATPVVE